MFATFIRTATLIAIATWAPAAFAQEIGRPFEPAPGAPQGFIGAAPQTYTMPNTATTTLSPTQLPTSAPAPTVVLPTPPARPAEAAHADAPRCWCHQINPVNNSVMRTKCAPECCYGESAIDGC
jgi:hypothetical protein